ncbi:MAG: hypothetical protein Nk1A_7710 [Endomicrobiia bacterium]|nr:MAG: hypothetical protein Nk1A_7710 [Endomicrobiia bacterium]
MPAAWPRYDLKALPPSRRDAKGGNKPVVGASSPHAFEMPVAWPRHNAKGGILKGADGLEF